MLRTPVLASALAVSLLSACSADLEIPDGARVSCASDADCPGGYVCRQNQGRCFKAGGDVTPPGIVGTIAVSPARVGANTAAVTVSFTTTEALGGDTAAFLSFDGGTRLPLSIAVKDAATHAYELTYAPRPGQDPEGQAYLVATLTDETGNLVDVPASPATVFDFTPPALALDNGGKPIAAIALTPPATSPLRDVGAATIGTRLRVEFATTEPVFESGGQAPAVSLGTGGAVVTLAQVSGNGLSFVYDTTLAAGLPAGPAPVSARITDLAGNATDVSLGSVTISTATPATPSVGTPDAILFRRVPWGSEETSGAQAYFLRGAAGSVPAGATVIAYSDPLVVTAGGALVGREIARTGAAADGSFGGDVADRTPFQLFMGDAPDVYVAAVDAAGNVSDADGDPRNGLQAALVRDVAWTATLLGKLPGRVFPNPHGFEGREVWTTTLRQSGAKPLATPAQVSRQDGAAASVRGAPRFTPARQVSHLAPRGGTAIVHDPARGCRVAFGGIGWDACDSGFWCEQWESCRGQPWRKPAVADPEGDGNPALASGVPMVFAGGRGGTVLSDGTSLWEWDGASWRKIPMADPEGDGDPVPRTGHAIAYDEARGRVFLFGGRAVAGGASLDDLWESDFRSWRRLCTAAACTATRPAARYLHALVWDPARKNLALVGGLVGTGFDSATWTWNGTAWTARCSLGACALAAQRRDHGLTFDAGRNVAVLFGGTASSGTATGTFEWNGTTWTQVCTAAPCSTTVPTPRSRPSLFHDPDRGRVVLYGGEVGFGDPECTSSPFCGTEWEWSGSAWTQVAPAGAYPPAVDGAMPVHDPVRDRVVLFGGTLDSTSTFTNATWLWDGAGWSSPAVAAPSVRARYAATWVATGANAGYVAIAGGVTTGFALVPQANAYQIWTGSTWASVGFTPQARSSSALAQATTASPPGGALLFGGSDASSNELCDVWTLSAGAWTGSATCPAGGPAARFGHAMVRATGFAGAPVVLFGGAGTTEYNDVWTHNGSSWTRVSAGGAQSATQPRTRVGHGLLLDTARNRVLMWGGSPAAAVANINCVDDYGGLACHDFWEWSGSAWTRVFPVDVFGDGQPDERDLVGIAWDTTRRRGVGIENAGATVRNWWWDGGGDDRPAQLASILFDAAEVTRAHDVLDLEVTWVGGGAGAPSGTVTNGATLQLWDNRAWRSLLTSTTARPGAPEVLRWTLSGDAALAAATPVAERRRFMVGDQRALHLALVPRALSGSAAGMGEVATDYVEVTVRYRLAP